MGDSIEEKKVLCSRILLTWITEEQQKKDMSIHDKEVEELFTSKIILSKFKHFNIDIVLPDSLLVLLTVCTNSNPGQFQIVLKYLLNNIVKKKGPIPAGYVISSKDFVYCFPTDYPIMEIPEIDQKFMKLWDKQKTSNGANACDTVDWWKEVMK